MSWTSGEIIRSSRVEDRTQRNQASGYVGLDGGGHIPYDVLSGWTYWNAAWADHISTQYSSWVQNILAGQTILDIDLVGTGNTLIAPSGFNLSEIYWSNLKLLAGTYNIIITYIKDDGTGILEVLHGDTSIGTVDTYNAVTTYNVVVNFIYTLTNNKTANFRIRVNGTSYQAYFLYISKIEIVRI